MIWSVAIMSEDKFSDENKDLMIELIDNETHKAIGNNQFVLHNILEENGVLEAIIEGNEGADKNLIEVLKENLNRMLVHANFRYDSISI